jgi:hypothetical protein
MARKRHSKKGVQGVRRRRSSRRGMGAVTSGIVGLGTDVLALGAGMIAAKYVSNKFLANQSDMIKGAAPVVAGIVLHQFVKNSMVKSVGTGMILSPVVSYGTTALGIGDLMADISPEETSIMEDITIGEVTIAEDITIGGYEGENIYE